MHAPFAAYLVVLVAALVLIGLPAYEVFVRRSSPRLGRPPLKSEWPELDVQPRAGEEQAPESGAAELPSGLGGGGSVGGRGSGGGGGGGSW